jgi:hypothetical protein
MYVYTVFYIYFLIQLSWHEFQTHNTIKCLKVLVYFVVKIVITFWAQLHSCEKWQLAL